MRKLPRSIVDRMLRVYLQMPKIRLCRCGCGSPLPDGNTLRKAATIECSIKLAKAATAKKERKALSEQRKQTRVDKARIKTRQQWRSEAGIAFRAYIRERDRGLACICCGSYGPDDDWLTGGKWDAGHFLSVGSHPELEFEPLNCHLQLKTCNSGSGKYGKFHSNERIVSTRYRIGLIARIGFDKVEWLEGPHEPKKHTIDEFMEIKAKYTKMRRELEKERL